MGTNTPASRQNIPALGGLIDLLPAAQQASLPRLGVVLVESGRVYIGDLSDTVGSGGGSITFDIGGLADAPIQPLSGSERVAISQGGNNYTVAAATLLGGGIDIDGQPSIVLPAQDGDELLVERGGTIYKIARANLIAIQPLPVLPGVIAATDLIAVQRGTTMHHVTRSNLLAGISAGLDFANYTARTANLSSDELLFNRGGTTEKILYPNFRAQMGPRMREGSDAAVAYPPADPPLEGDRMIFTSGANAGDRWTYHAGTIMEWFKDFPLNDGVLATEPTVYTANRVAALNTETLFDASGAVLVVDAPPNPAINDRFRVTHSREGPAINDIQIRIASIGMRLNSNDTPGFLSGQGDFLLSDGSIEFKLKDDPVAGPVGWYRYD